MIVFDLNTNDAESMLTHTEQFEPGSGDAREDARLREALLELKEALMSHIKGSDT
jgi:hypothetical protein